MLSALSDITTQLVNLSEDVSLVSAESAINELTQDVANISARLVKHKQRLKVREIIIIF